MTEITTGKANLTMFCILIAIVSVFGLLGGIIRFVWSGDKGWIALIVVSVLAFIGSIFTIFYVSYLKKPHREKRVQRIKKPTKKTIIWIVVATISGVGAVLTYFLGLKMSNVPMLPMFILIAFLAGLFLYALFVLISGRKQRLEGNVDIEYSTDINNHLITDQEEDSKD